jgi:hypothetical protein
MKPTKTKKKPIKRALTLKQARKIACEVCDEAEARYKPATVEPMVRVWSEIAGQTEYRIKERDLPRVVEAMRGALLSSTADHTWGIVAEQLRAIGVEVELP